MQPHTQNEVENQIKQPLRAIVEIRGAELTVFPVADGDIDEKIILDALRFAVENEVQQLEMRNPGWRPGLHERRAPTMSLKSGP